MADKTIAQRLEVLVNDAQALQLELCGDSGHLTLGVHAPNPRYPDAEEAKRFCCTMMIADGDGGQIHVTAPAGAGVAAKIMQAAQKTRSMADKLTQGL